MLALACGSVAWIALRHDRIRRSLLTRIDAIATPYARANRLYRMGRRLPSRSSATRIRLWIARALGYEPERASHYPVRAPIVLGLALLAAVAAAEAADFLVGSASRLFIPIAWIVLSRRAFAWFEQRRSARLYVQFPDALAMIVRSVRVGIPVSEAVRNVAQEALEPTCTEFALLSDQLTIGVALDEALRDIAARNNLPEYRFFATALALQAQTGGGLSDTLEGLADVIRKRVAVRRRAHALASEARTSTYVLAALPVFTGLALAVINPAYISLLFTDPTGKAVLAAAIGMLSTGMVVMRTTITRTLR